MDVPEIVIGHLSENRILSRTSSLPINALEPTGAQSQKLNQEFEQAHDVLTKLRQRCASYDDWEAGNVDDTIW